MSWRWWLDSISDLFFKKKWAIPGLFLLIFVFSIQLIKNKCSIKFCRWLESNRGPLVSKATALPTEPQPRPTAQMFLMTKSERRQRVVLPFVAGFWTLDPKILHHVRCQQYQKRSKKCSIFLYVLRSCWFLLAIGVTRFGCFRNILAVNLHKKLPNFF